MAEKVLKIKSVSEVAEAISGLTDLTGSLKGVGTAAFEAAGKSKAEWKALEEEWQKANPTLKGIADAAFGVQDALNRMGRASTESQLEGALIKAQVALTQYKAKLEEVRAAGGTIDEGMRSSLAVMESGVQAGTEKLKAMREATAEAKEQLGLVAKSAEQAGDGAKKLATGAAAADNALSALGEEGARVVAALARLDASGDSPRALQRAAAMAEVEVNQLRASLEEAAASGKSFGPEVAASLAAAEAKIASANEKAAEFRDVTADMTTRGDLAAKGFESLAGSAGSLEGMLGKLKDTGTKSQQAIADFGFKAIAAFAAFDYGLQKGKEFNGFLQEHGNILGKLIELQIQEIDKLGTEKELLSALPIAANAALRAKQTLNEETAKTLEALQKEAGGWTDLDKVRKDAIDRAQKIGERYLELKSAGKDWRGEMELQRDSIIANQGVLNRLGVSLADVPLAFTKVVNEISDFDAKLDEAARKAVLTGDGIRGLRDTLAALPSNLDNFKLPEVIDGLSKAIASARAEGKDWSVILTDYEKELNALREACEKAGVEGLDLFRKKILDLIPAHQAATAALGDQAKATEEWLKRESAAYDQAAAAAEKRRAAEDAATNRTSKAPDEFRAIQQAAFGAAVAYGELGTNLDRVADAVVATGGTMTVGAPILISLAEASDQVSAALYRQLEASKLLREEQMKSIDANAGVMAYLANLKGALDTNTISLTTYIGLLNQLRTQFLTLFGTVTGEAKKNIQDLIDMIQAMISTAGAGGAGYDPSYAGELGRRFGGQ